MIRNLLKYLAAVLIFAIIAGLSAFFTLSFVIKSEDTVKVPALEGKNAVEALEILSNLGLNTKVRDSEYSDDVAENHVIKQFPSPGEVIKKGRNVALIISKGPESVTVPDLSGQNQGRAEIMLEKNGLVAGHISRSSSAEFAKDTIIAQQPEPQEGVSRATPVNLLVSTGPALKSFKMPELAGRFLDDAMLVIDSHGMELVEVKSVQNPEKPENMVTAQAPPAGYRVSEDTNVRLLVNRLRGKHKKNNGESRVLFSYRVPAGFLKEHVRLEINMFGTRITLYDKLVEPDTLIWAVIPENAEGAAFLYLNQELVKSEILD
ncbi:MAG: PASTA domain-containing protein [Desulfobacteraceae bacterium]|nr:PASTA domain-containing protein [Desulfobacteraceae bacterium]